MKSICDNWRTLLAIAFAINVMWQLTSRTTPYIYPDEREMYAEYCRDGVEEDLQNMHGF